MVQAQLVFNNSDSKFNKDLVRFFKENLANVITKAGITFHFVVAQKSDIERLNSQGVTKLPILVLPNERIVGTPNIIDYLSSRVQKATPVVPKSEDQILEDYMSREMMSDVKRVEKQLVINNDEDEEDEKADMSQKIDNIRKARYNDEKKQPPPYPSRNVQFDGDIQMDRHVPLKNKPQTANTPLQHDTDDPMAVLNKMDPSRDSRDDEMMRAWMNNTDTGLV
jgi:hypothetical protein